MAGNSFSFPEVVGGFKVYSSNNELIGISDEVTLPEFAALTDNMAGPGVLGEVETAAFGHFGSMEMEIPFRQANPTMFTLVSTGPAVNVVLRGGMQQRDPKTGDIDWWPVSITVRGENKTLSLGKFKQAAGTGSSIKLELLYIKVVVNEVTEIELDKLNFVYTVHGIDVLAKLRAMCD